MKTQSIKFIAIVASCLFILFGNSQDVITLKNGNEVKSKVVEVEDADIKYRKFENLTGPVYSISKTEVFMIQYENGSKEVYNTPTAIPQSQQGNIETIQPPVHKSEKEKATKPKYRKEIAGGVAMISLSIPMLVTGGALTGVGMAITAEQTDPNGYYGADLWISGIALLVASTPLLIAGPIQLSKGIKHRRAYKSGRAFMDFCPISNKYFDTHFHTFNPAKLGSVTFNF
jgi:hypothetical protein